MNVLITGANGQLGYNLQKILSKKYNLILTDSDTMDITNASLAEKVIKKNHSDVIIHAAAYTKVDDAEINKKLCRKINILGTKNIARIAKKYNILLIYISTDYVFDGKSKRPYTEKKRPNPLSEYGLTKFEGERCVRKNCKRYYIIRSSWIFGKLPKKHSGSNFVITMLKLSREKKKLAIVNDQIGSPTYAKDLVEIISKIIDQKPSYGVYHFSGNDACSWYDFAKEIFRLSNTKIEIEPINSCQFPQKAKRPAYSYLNKMKIEKALKINVKSWKEMLKEYFSCS